MFNKSAFHFSIAAFCFWSLITTVQMQSFGSQEWDTGFAIQALLASDLTNEIGPTLMKGHNFIKESQVPNLNS